MNDVYISVKDFTLFGVKHPKDKQIAVDDIGRDNINRLLKNGYIKIAGAKSLAKPIFNDSSSLPFYMTAADYLSPSQVDGLNKKQLVEYAGRIGVAGFKANISTTDLKALIKQFIEDADDEGADGDEEE